MPLIIALFFLISVPTQAQKLNVVYGAGNDVVPFKGSWWSIVIERDSIDVPPRSAGDGLLLIEASPFNTNDIPYIVSNGYDLSKPLYHIYWNPDNNLYFYAKAGSLLTKTNGLTYKLDPAKTNATLVYHPKAKYAAVVNGQKVVKTKKNIEKLFARNLQPDLAFAGWISSNQRLFIHIPTQEQYIQTLEFIRDVFEAIPKLTITKRTNYPEISPFPEYYIPYHEDSVEWRYQSRMNNGWFNIGYLSPDF